MSSKESSVKPAPDAKSSDMMVVRNEVLETKGSFASSETKYLHLAVLVSALTIGAYCSFEYLRQGLIEYLVASIVSGLFFVASFLPSILGSANYSAPSELLPEKLLSHDLFKKYMVICDDIREFENHKRSLLEETVTGQLKELIESRLPLMLSRRDSYSKYWSRCDSAKLEKEIAELRSNLENEKDDDIKKVISRNLSIAESTGENYEKIKKALKLYDLQIATVGQHLENLDTKIHILELEADMHDAAKDVIEDITGDIDDIEETLSQMDLPGPQ